eukprot:14852390-Alexandrium_andersonii.AAC.1
MADRDEDIALDGRCQRVFRAAFEQTKGVATKVQRHGSCMWRLPSKRSRQPRRICVLFSGGFRSCCVRPACSSGRFGLRPMRLLETADMLFTAPETASS